MNRLKEDEGFSTLGMVVALLLTLSLLFTTAQVCRLTSASAAIQDVADAAALAAEDQIAEFMIVVKTCDAVALSMTLTAFAATSIGIVCLCVPATATLSAQLLSAGKKILKARDSFVDKASSGLDAFQTTLPFLAAVHAAQVSSANDGSSPGHSYVALAIVSPEQGKDIESSKSDEAREVQDEVDEDADDVKEKAQRAEDAARQANEAKLDAFDHDCGANPNYCMYERALALSSIDEADNPLFSSVDSWSFSVALSRTQAYYVARARDEHPDSQSVLDQARSEMRSRYYLYAEKLVSEGYVREVDGSFSANLPVPPRNTEQMRKTSLYTEEAYPVTSSGESQVMHAWEGCPSAAGFGYKGSLAQLEEGSFSTCPDCQFTVYSLGRVGEASSSIDNGFEYHYRIVSEDASQYMEAVNRGEPDASSVKRQTEDMLSKAIDAFKEAANMRIEANPPGSNGVVVLVADVASVSADEGFVSSFVRGGGSLGARAAVSGATLVADPSGEGANVISSLLDGVGDKGGALTGGLGLLLDCWSSMLQAYTNGSEALEEGMESALGAIPLASASGLGTWASGKLKQLLEDFSLDPINLDALKPVLVNSAYVAAADSGSFFSVYGSAKEQALRSGGEGGLFGSVVDQMKDWVSTRLEGTIELAVIYPLGEGGPAIPLTITLPPSVREAAGDAVASMLYRLRDLMSFEGRVSVWR